MDKKQTASERREKAAELARGLNRWAGVAYFSSHLGVCDANNPVPTRHGFGFVRLCEECAS